MTAGVREGCPWGRAVAEPASGGQLCAGVKKAASASSLGSQVEAMWQFLPKKADVCHFLRKAIKQQV